MAASHSSAISHRGKSATQRDRSNNLGHGLRDAWQQIIRAVFDTYRPELHYMRGPGPACASKRSKQQ